MVTANIQMDFVVPVVSFPKAGLLFQGVSMYSL